MNQERDSSQRFDNKRKTAKRLFVSDVLSATYIKRPGWEPSGIITKYGEIARVYLIGTVVSRSDEEKNFLVDDGTGNISVRYFEDDERFSSLSLGDMVCVIGRPREWNESKYIVPEIVRKLQDAKWHKVHQLEIKLQKKDSVKLPVETEDEQEVQTGPYQKILNAIAVLDKGDGVDIQDIINHIKIANGDKIVRDLIEEGEIFELSPGRVKLLE
ncbi:hypothetical protein JXC34_06060 [Candidatus Woesearchaeota archaeon]|nr:hypothetical protein [Candidatus Woesearchaeota archaeon]